MNTQIDYLDKCINIICGCTNGCGYCWARNRVAPRLAHNCKLCGKFVPHFHEERLKLIDRIKKPSIVGLNFMGDTWDKNAKPEWRQDIFEMIEKYWRQDFIILTKQPQNIKNEGFGIYGRIEKLDNFWVGVSIDTYRMIDRWVALSQKEYIKHKIISFEPVLDSFVNKQGICSGLQYYFKTYGFPDWIIIGALTKSDKERMLFSRHQSEILLKSLLDIKNRPPIFVKDNVYLEKQIKEFPKELL